MHRKNLKNEEEMKDIEESKKEKKEKSLKRVQTANNVNSLLDLSDILAIFAMHLKDNWRNYLVQTARYPMFIAAAGFAVIGAILAGRRANLMDNRNGSAQLAIIKSVSAALIVGAVGIGLFGPEALAEWAPYIFAGVLGFQGITSGVNALGAKIQASSTTDQAEKEALNEAAKGNGIGSVVLGLVTAAVIAVMILKMNELAALGVGGTGIGIAYTLREMTKGNSRRRDGYQQVATEEPFELIEAEENKSDKRQNTDLVLLSNMKSESKKQPKKATEKENPYQPIPVITRDTKATVATDNVIPLPTASEVRTMNLGGTIKYAVWNEPIAKSCPKCAWPMLTIKKTKKRGTELVCARQTCGFVEQVDDIKTD